MKKTGSSAPELGTVIIGVFFAKDDIGVSGVIGSAVFNIMFVISVCALFSGTVCHLNWWPLVRDCFFYSLSIIVMLIIMLNDYISWVSEHRATTHAKTIDGPNTNIHDRIFFLSLFFVCCMNKPVWGFNHDFILRIVLRGVAFQYSAGKMGIFIEITNQIAHQRRAIGIGDI